MALARVKTWSSGEVLTATDLNAEFNNILNNGAALVSPWPASTLDLDGNTLILDSDADTSIVASTDDQIDITIAGANDFRLLANTFLVLAGSIIDLNGENNALTLDADADTVLDCVTDDQPIIDMGVTGFLLVRTSDTRTNTVDVPEIIESQTSGTPAAGIGVGTLYRAESGDEAPSEFGQIEFVASDVTAASEDTYFQILLRVAGAALTSCYRFAATGAFNAIFTHANSAARTYTLQNSDDTLVGRATTDTLTNKTLTDPIINLSTAAPATPVANRVYADSLVKGFVVFSVTGAIDTDLNVSSITDNGVGDWTVNWATAFSTANYAISLTLQATVTSIVDTTLNGPVFRVDPGNNPTASACRVVSLEDSAGGAIVNVDPTGTRVRMYVTAFGVQ